jgi:hypothetical protein
MPYAIPRLLPPALELFHSIFSGALSVLAGKPLTDPSSELPPDFLDATAAFASSLIRHKGAIADSIASSLLPLLDRTIYESLVLDVFVDGIASDALSPPLIQSLLDILPRLIECAHNSTRQTIVFTLSLLSRRDPGIVSSLVPVVPVLLQWWNGSAALPLLRANLAAFFLYLAVVAAETVAPDLVLLALDAFPPADCDEAPFMAGSLLALAGGGSLSDDGLVRVALALSRLLTETKGVRRRMRIPGDTFAALVALFRALCANGAIAQAVFASVEGRAAKAEALAAVLRSGDE